MSQDRKGRSIQELAKNNRGSRATIARHTSRTGDEWIAQKAAQREHIRAYHDNKGHSWSETAQHFDLHIDTVKQRAYRARRERLDERNEAA